MSNKGMKKPYRYFLTMLLLAPAQVLAWGAIGHQTVGFIAASHLSPQAKVAVEKLLNRESLPGVANWADSLKSGTSYRQTVWYHFEKISDDVSYLENLSSLPDYKQKSGGVVAAILVAYDTLKTGTAPVKEQIDALKFLVHFVGDIHQPLHTGRPEDKGGVTINVNWLGRDMSLHRVWDSGMIETGHENIIGTGYPFEKASLALANELERTQGKTILTASLDVNTWLNESMALRKAAYDKIYKTNQVKYQNLHLPEVDQRLYIAGLRLADMLNNIYSNNPVPMAEINLWKDIENIMGNLYSVIKLRP